MRCLPLLFLCCACATSREVAVPRVALPAPSSAPVSSTELTVARAACPLKRTGTPGCKLVPASARGRGLLSASRFNCKLATAPQRLHASAEPALLFTAYVTEGATSYGVRALRNGAGELLSLPEQLSNPGLLDGALIGFAPYADEAAFWKDDVCESPAGGRLTDLAVREGGELVALQQNVEKQSRVLLRSRDGRWSVLGPVPWGVEPYLAASNGRVSVLGASLQPAEWTAHFPDLGRTLVLRRIDTPTWDRPRATAQLAATPGTRFSPAVTVASDAQRRWSVRWPGAGRLELPLPVTTPQCPTPEGSERPRETGYLTVHSPDVAALSDTQLLVSWFEEKGRCDYRFVEKQPVRCERNQPCIDTPPAHWEVSSTELGGDVVIARVGSTVREVSRLALGPPEAYSVFSTSISVTPQRVLVTAGGHLLEYDRSALEEK